MSEYQYYEFKAIDKPLNEKDMQALRNLSTRARITSTSFVNEYNWSDLKGNQLIDETHKDATYKKTSVYDEIDYRLLKDGPVKIQPIWLY